MTIMTTLKFFLLMLLFCCHKPSFATDYQNPLTKALMGNQISVVEALLKKTDFSEKYHPYFIVIAGKNPDSTLAKRNIELLLHYGYKSDSHKTHAGEFYDLMVWAVKNNKIQMIDLLMTKYDQGKFIDSYFDRAFDGLKRATKESDTSLQFLINKGLNINSYGVLGPRVMGVAEQCYSGDEQEEAKIAMLKLVKLGANLNLQNDQGDTILHKVASEGAKDDLLFFKQLGINPSIKNNNDLTADDIFNKRKLLLILKEGSPAKLESLLKQGIPLTNNEYEGLLELAAKTPNPSEATQNVKLLLYYGYTSTSKRFTQNEYLETARIAAEANNTALMAFILSKVDVYVIPLDYLYFSAFIGLGSSPKKEDSALQFLIKRGLDIHSPQNEVQLFDFASSFYEPEALYEPTKREKRKQALMNLVANYNVNINLQDQDGNTILHHVASIGISDDQDFIKQLGVNPLLKNNKGKTADNIFNHRQQIYRLQTLIPIIISFLFIIMLVFSYRFKHKINDRITDSFKRYSIRIPFSLVGSIGLSFSIAYFLTLDASLFEGGKGYAFFYSLLILIPFSFALLLLIRNPAAQLTFTLYTVSILYLSDYII